MKIKRLMDFFEILKVNSKFHKTILNLSSFIFFAPELRLGLGVMLPLEQYQ